MRFTTSGLRMLWSVPNLASSSGEGARFSLGTSADQGGTLLLTRAEGSNTSMLRRGGYWPETDHPAKYLRTPASSGAPDRDAHLLHLHMIDFQSMFADPSVDVLLSKIQLCRILSRWRIAVMSISKTSTTCGNQLRCGGFRLRLRALALADSVNGTERRRGFNAKD